MILTPLVKLGQIPLLLAVLSSLSAPAADLYVSSTGMDSNPGTKAAPFKNPAAARDAARVVHAGRERGPRGVDGKELTNADLDICHGTTSEITMPDGTKKVTYHYVLNREYPHSVGCFRGKVNYNQALGPDNPPNTPPGEPGGGRRRAGASASAAAA